MQAFLAALFAALTAIFAKAMQMGQASQVAPIDKLSVVFVAILAAVFLGERL